jgi:hypothetical protein
MTSKNSGKGRVFVTQKQKPQEALTYEEQLDARWAYDLYYPNYKVQKQGRQVLRLSRVSHELFMNSPFLPLLDRTTGQKWKINVRPLTCTTCFVDKVGGLSSSEQANHPLLQNCAVTFGRLRKLFTSNIFQGIF